MKAKFSVFLLFSCCSSLSLAFIGSCFLIDPAKAQGTLPSTSSEESKSSALKFDLLISKASEQGFVRVIIGLKVNFIPEGNLAASTAITQRSAIAQAQDVVLNKISAYGPTGITEFKTVPYLAATLNTQALSVLKYDPNIISIQEDVPVPPTLAESTSVIKANNAWVSGFTGAGQTVAILDTGVDSSHPFLSDKVVSEACYGTTDSSYQSTTVCPNGLEEQIGIGSGVNCPIFGCDHGTHVAGIAAGKGSSFSGVARDANIIAIQVFSRFNSNSYCNFSVPCALSYTSDQIEGLEQVYSLRSSFKIAAVNMSLGGGQSTSNCDTDARKAVIDNLRSAGIATVIASGNNGFTNALSFPACISSAISVGSTGDGSNGATQDVVSSYSNNASFLSLLAPGEWINSSVPGGSFSRFQGTSMAAPHVAGAWAILKQKTPSVSVSKVLAAYQATGTSITDSRNGITKPRINVITLSTEPVAEGDTIRPGEVLNPGQSITSTSSQYTFAYQGDGNLVLYRNSDGKPLWASNTWGTTPGKCVMQGDGNLVIYDQNDNPVWSTNTWQYPGSRLVVQSDGNVVMYDPNNKPVWWTNTWQR